MFEMANANPAEAFEFFMDKEECRVAEDNLRSTLFSSETVDLPMEWKTEPSDFSVDELLGSYFTESDLGSCAEVGTLPSGPEPSLKGDRRRLSLKDEEDFEPFRDLVSLPFDAVMDSLDPSLEAASDSGLSTENLADFMLSPSSGATSPEPRGDISVDTLDAISDVSSTSDLGSLTSAGSSPNGRSSAATTHLFPATHLDQNGTTGATIPQHLVDDLDMSDIAADSLSSYNTVLSASNYPRTMVVTPTQAFTKLNSSTPASSTTVCSVAASATHQQPPVATRSIKLDLGATTIVGKAVTCITNNNTTTTNSNASRTPFLAKVSAATGSATAKIGAAPAVSRTTSPQTIVVTQGRKANPVLKNSTLLKTGNGRSILLPVNVSDLNQVRTIKIISGGANNGVNKCASPAGVRTLVSTVRPVGSSSTTSTAGTRATFYTTSKGSDGLSLLKVTPTALVSPTTHNANANRVSGMSAYIKEEPSDDEMPNANQDLVFTDEERKLMKKEGLVLPSRYPLTKQEERDLKRIRRKIRNKISAQDSRKRKKEYVDGLEDRVKNCTEENQQLHKKIKTLEKQNESLLVQLKRFQNMVGGGIYYNKPHNHTSTALMMLILSAALFVVPSLRSQDNKGENELTGNNKMPSAGHSRSLLEARNTLNLKTMEGGFLSNDEEELTSNSFSPHPLSDHDYAPAAKQARLESSVSLISPPNVDKTLSREDGDPPDSTGGGLQGVAALIGAMLDRLGGNWTDPGGSSFKLNGSGALNRTPSHVASDRASVVVSLNHGKRLRDDIELE